MNRRLLCIILRGTVSIPLAEGWYMEIAKVRTA